MAMLNAPTMECDRVNLRRSVPVQERQQIFETVPVRHRGTLSDEVAPLPEQVEPHYSTVPFRKIFVNAAKDVLRLVAWLAHGDTGDEVDHFAEHHLSSAGRLWSLGRTPFRPGVATSIAAIASSISLPMLGCLAFGLKVRPARLLRHPEHVLRQIQLVGVLAGCGILGAPA